MVGSTMPAETPSINSGLGTQTFCDIETSVIIALLLIVGIIAVVSRIVFSKSQQELIKVAGPILTVAIALAGALFGGDDSYRVRIILMAIGLVGYAIFYLATWGVLILVNKGTRTRMVSGESQIKITLPIDYEYTVDKRFIEDIPGNVEGLIHICEEIRILTTCKLNNLDLFVKMSKPPLWTAFGYV